MLHAHNDLTTIFFIVTLVINLPYKINMSKEHIKILFVIFHDSQGIILSNFIISIEVIPPYGASNS